MAVVGSWKKRGVSGPDERIIPSKSNYLQVCIARATDNSNNNLFAPVNGFTFDSCKEAYEMYNLFSWENGFGIRHGKTRINEAKYKTMHQIVCQCQVLFVPFLTDF
ncbi:hypothetical protein VPH35_112629 [Triticum aestivum]